MKLVYYSNNGQEANTIEDSAMIENYLNEDIILLKNMEICNSYLNACHHKPKHQCLYDCRWLINGKDL